MKDRAEELLVESALRPLDDRERAELHQLVPGGDPSFEAAATAIVLATTPIEPMPDHLIAKIMAAAPQPDFKRTLAGVSAPLGHDTIVGVALESFKPPPVIDIAQRREARKPRRAIAPWLAAAACLLVAAGAVWFAWQRQPGSVADARAALLASADAKPIAWLATADPNAKGASGDVVWSTAQQRGYMRFVGLAANDPRQFQYQLWIFDKARDDTYPVDGGVFDVSSTGEVIVTISPKLHVTDATLFAVTVERPGGVVVSKRERIVVTAARS
ncbi:MAG TPA: anti-sigma factor [Kofleriaceae bacterium]|nr:anti-sigma factor [Kofleriaceae bacterium]